jgi:hypothetical protein
MKRNKLVVLAILTIGLGALLFVVLRGSPEEVHKPPAVAVAPIKPPGRNPLTLSQLFKEGRAKAGEAVEPEPDTGASTPGIEESVGELLDSDPQLRKFYNLRRKAVRTSAEQQDYLAMISDAKIIDDARKDLLAAASSKEVDQVEELKRLERIKFLNSALAWEDNPERTRALGAVTEVVMQQVPGGAPKDVIGSVMGDKFDLFQLLMLSDPDQAKALLAKAQGTSAEKILQLAWTTGSADAPKKPTP